ncbi:MAG TPA: isochorismate synthase [Acidimicrobiia bacterium]|nr:isochorismate synthase [Acidimicrobiia bacterium]
MTGVAALVPDGLRAVTREVGASRAGRAGAGTLLGSLAPGGFAWLQANGGAATGFVTSGEVARVPADEATALLDAIEVDDAVGAPGTGAVAVGALPFDPAAGGELVVPARVFGRAPDGRLWHTEIGPATVAPVVSRVPPTRFDVRAVDTRDGWRAAVEAILAAIDAGTVEKVVLAREVVVEADEDFPVAAVLARLHAQQPGCYVYAAGDLVGASPELLVRRAGAVAESRPMAGTVACDAGDEAVAALAESLKDAREHQFVVDAILAALDGRCESLDVAATPEIARFSSVAHLVTPIRAVLHAPAPSALDLARALHPTPAVGGTPRAEALTLIEQLERRDRGRYAGPVGWVDADGDGEWAVALRGGEVRGNTAVLRAGAGIVAGSDPDAEWAETEAKLDPMLRALVRP